MFSISSDDGVLSASFTTAACAALAVEPTDAYRVGAVPLAEQPARLIACVSALWVCLYCMRRGALRIPVPIGFKSTTAYYASITDYDGLGQTTDMLLLCLSKKFTTYSNMQDEGSREVGQRVRPAQQHLLGAMPKSPKGMTKHPCILARTCPPNPLEASPGCAKDTTLQH